MKHNMTTRIATTMAALCALLSPAAAQNYSKVYDALPDMTLDQAYCALIEFQKGNPYFANTYLQLASICEKKMIIYDPLREYGSMKFWAGNAALFYGNLRVYYTENDVRSEFYENLKIPFSGKRITDADLWNYVERHKEMCKNHSDTTTLIYEAIEGSRRNYNLAIEAFKSICNDYSDLNDMLLRHDAALAARLGELRDYAANSERLFAEYKRLTDLYPIANYKQLFEKAPIETFRLDGLTNSDFFNNRFTMWDYAGWLDKFDASLRGSIVPLRREVERIGAAYAAGREEFANGGVVSACAAKPYDKLFEYNLLHFDVGSVVAPLFDYLDATRQMLAMAGDSLGRDVSAATDLAGRKMRRLYQLTQTGREAERKREALMGSISAAKVARFAEFFKKQYGGEAGLRLFLAGEEAFCQSVVDSMSSATAAYMTRTAATLAATTDTYSTARSAAAPSVPLWVTLEPKSLTSKYVSTHVCRDGQNKVVAVAGHAKGNAKSWFVAGIAADGSTQWLTRLAGVNSVTSVAATDDGLLVAAIRKLKPALIYVGKDGKELASVNSEAETVDMAGRDGASGSIYWLSGNELGAPTLCKAADGAGGREWAAALGGMSRACDVGITTRGFVVTGLTPGGDLATVSVSPDGTAGEAVTIMSGVEAVVATQRVSSAEMAALVRTADGRHKYMTYRVDD